MTDVRLAAESWESLFRAQVALMRRFTSDDIWEPLTVREYDLLFALSRAPRHGMRLHELNSELLLSQPSVSRMVERLAARGLVTKGGVPDDRRGTWVTLTPDGARLQKEIGRRHVERIAAYVGGALTDDELRTLAQITTKLRSAQPHITASPSPAARRSTP